MAEIKTQIGDIAYNAMTGCYEALVTFHSPLGRFSVAAEHKADLSAEFEEISDGILRSALDNITRPGALRSRMMPAKPASLPDSAPHAA